jgi:multisubunit Na+/H+ antiporter MnhE subunit
MVTASQRRFVFAQAGWTAACVALLAALGSLSLELVFVGAFLGFAVVTALTAPFGEGPGWRSWLRWPLLAGTVLFLVVVGMRTLEKFVGTF